MPILAIATVKWRVCALGQNVPSFLVKKVCSSTLRHWVTSHHQFKYRSRYVTIFLVEVRKHGVFEGLSLLKEPGVSNPMWASISGCIQWWFHHTFPMVLVTLSDSISPFSATNLRIFHNYKNILFHFGARKTKLIYLQRCHTMINSRCKKLIRPLRRPFGSTILRRRTQLGHVQFADPSPGKPRDRYRHGVYGCEIHQWTDGLYRVNDGLYRVNDG